VVGYQSFGGPCRLHLQGEVIDLFQDGKKRRRRRLSTVKLILNYITIETEDCLQVQVI
jgi:hypothetical protein